VIVACGVAVLAFPSPGVAASGWDISDTGVLALLLSEMEKLGTTWSSLSISTTFRVKVVNDAPLVCASTRGERHYSETCGFGWRFAMLYSSYSQSIMFEYDAHYAHRGLGTMQVAVTLKAEEMSDGEYYLREMRPADPDKRMCRLSYMPLVPNIYRYAYRILACIRFRAAPHPRLQGFPPRSN
jgi:hypothetical protein